MSTFPQNFDTTKYNIFRYQITCHLEQRSTKFDRSPCTICLCVLVEGIWPPGNKLGLEVRAHYTMGQREPDLGVL